LFEQRSNILKRSAKSIDHFLSSFYPCYNALSHGHLRSLLKHATNLWSTCTPWCTCIVFFCMYRHRRFPVLTFMFYRRAVSWPRTWRRWLCCCRVLRCAYERSLLRSSSWYFGCHSLLRRPGFILILFVHDYILFITITIVRALIYHNDIIVFIDFIIHCPVTFIHCFFVPKLYLIFVIGTLVWV